MGIDAGALAALRVVDCSTGVAGSYCAKLLREAGADVIVAEPAVGHPLRDRAGGALFVYLRQGQRSVVGDDASSLAAVLAGADLIIVEPGGPLGDPDVLADAHPDKVVVSISPFGLHGPYAGRIASELTVQAESGALGIRGRPERPPVQAGGDITQWVTGDYAAVGALAAALELRRSGRGNLVDVSWAEVANVTCTLFADLFDKVAGRPDLSATPCPRSFETPSIEPTLDGYVGFNTNTRQQFGDFMVMIEQAERYEADPSWANLAVRSARWDEWNDIVHRWTTQRTTDEIVELAALFRIPVAPVTTAETVLQLKQALDRSIFVEDAAGSFRMPRRPWLFDGELPPPPQPAPEIGEHDGTIEAAGSWRTDSAVPVDDRGPFSGLRVIDLTGWWAGPSMAQVFANFGADVVHVESTTHPDGMRMAGGAFFVRPQWWELSSFFLAANTNKRSLTLDLRQAEGRELLLDLIADADLVIENYTPRVFESFDLGWDVIHAANPRAVMVRIPAFGLTGPWRDRPGFAETMEQITGLAWLTGHVDDQPRIQRGPCDPNVGMHAALAAMVALVERDRTGTGHLVEVPMFECALAIAAEPVIEWTANGRLLERNGNRTRHAAPQGVYVCEGVEQWIALTVSDEGWAAFVATIGRGDLVTDAHLSSREGRVSRHDELDAAICAWAATQAVGDAVDVLQKIGVAAAQVVDPRRTSDHPQFLARHFHEMVDHPVAGVLSTPTMPFRMRGIDTWVRTPAPTIGQHNAEVLARVGVDSERLAMLSAAGVIGTKPANL